MSFHLVTLLSGIHGELRVRAGLDEAFDNEGGVRHCDKVPEHVFLGAATV